MSKLNDIQNAILQMDGGRYQKMMDCYLFRKYGLSSISSLGSETGTDKTTKGTPDAYVRKDWLVATVSILLRWCALH